MARGALARRLARVLLAAGEGGGTRCGCSDAGIVGSSSGSSAGSRWLSSMASISARSCGHASAPSQPRLLWTSLAAGALQRSILAGHGNLQRGDRHHFSSDISELPNVDDPDIRKALSQLLAATWSDIDEATQALVAKALAKHSSDDVGKEALASAWRSAEASETFIEKLEHIRLELDELSGGKFAGENVGTMPSHLDKVLSAVLKRYNAYIESFSEEETWLKKKAEQELGTTMNHLKQRFNGMGADWSKLSVLGTSGLAGSYVERRT
eukprot:SM000163S02331  [mRNA]  locus=s163:308927:310507:- [translate_table: standard]